MNIEGILVPIVTPFTDGNEIDTALLSELVREFIARGVTGIVACGTTGEYYSLSEAERETVLTVIKEAAAGKCTLIAGISDMSTETAAKRAVRAKELGYDGLMLSAPPYSLPSQQGIIGHFEYVAAQTDLPVIMYNFPARVGTPIEFETVAHLARHPNIAGIKESTGDFSAALRMLQADFPDFEVICGCDDQPLDFFFWGAKSWIAGAANVFPDEQVALFRAARAGDWNTARALLAGMYPVLHSMESGDYNQKAKIGCLRGSRSAGGVRMPLHNLSRSEADAFLALLEA
ncbi:dihydrodipicolinate synthase family protein [Bergeriella denitrificans]|uniref:Dihydrodipicolinate synthase n=1 Tax=Bergeriella denitrificans TaxID=494 RepID=A0A378UJB3_BERDE|nr:dihydrodipicolinate synthase family protein [Bergeriella denitrificans]STZ77427.1 dihydrodipicolinate synthase [Bergeriella denitrificans]